MKNNWLIIVLVIGLAGMGASGVHAQNRVVTLPLRKEVPAVNEKVTFDSEGNVDTYTAVENPLIEVHLPSPEKATGAAIILYPGGALVNLAWKDEFLPVADFMNERGIAVVGVKYRTLPPAPRDGTPMPHPHPVTDFPQIQRGNISTFLHDEDNPALPAAVEDAAKAYEMVLEYAGEWSLKPAKIGTMGFSAGGIVMFAAMMQNPQFRPAFVCSIYGPSMFDIQVPENRPPLFMAVHADHPSVAAGCMSVFMEWKKGGADAEMHLYGKHTGGLFGGGVQKDRPTAEGDWKETLYSWLVAKRISRPKTLVSQSLAPEVLPDGRVHFRIIAPEARSVVINMEKDYPLVRGEKGCWETVTEPLQPGFHYYFVTADGIRTANPLSPSFFGYGMQASGIEVPYPDYDKRFVIQEVPHGKVVRQRYFSEVNGKWKSMLVYTPAGYERGKNYPVLYLIHGGGENEEGWMRQGRADILMDNLLGEGKVKPMIVVALDGQTSDFYQEFTTECMPTVEKEFKVKKDAGSRAIAGLSRGGIQTMETAFLHPELFSYVGVFSSALIEPENDRMRIVSRAPSEIYSLLMANPAKYNKQFRLFWLGQGGPEDISYAGHAVMRARFDEIGIKYQYFETPGGHTWPVWRECLYQFAPQLF